MFNADQVRSAVISTNPWVELRTIVESALDQGATLLGARQALIEFENSGWIVEELSVTGYEAFRDTIDNLAGMCSDEHKFREQITSAPARNSDVSNRTSLKSA